MPVNPVSLYPAIGTLIASIGRDDFGAAAFELVRQGIGADHIVAQFIEGHRLTGLFTEGRVAARIADTINRRYLERYHMLDQSLPGLRSAGRNEPVVLRVDPQLNASPAYSNYFFERVGLCDKLAMVANRGDEMVACNLYRLQATGSFSDDDIQAARELAPVLTAAVWRHVAETGRARLPSMNVRRDPEQPLRDALSSLSPREMDVCRRLLAGASNEAVALDLGLSAHTVRTLRKRLYKKLQVNSLGDLFARYQGAMAAVVSGER